ncbi:MAG: septum formation initiator family protein [Clostridia bacterium]|nr:septum formation initiator family protein [Deltaproteobacteria bacterium]
MMTLLRSLLACGLLFFAFGLIMHTLVAPNGWRARERVRIDLTQVREQNEARERKAEQLRAEVAALRDRADVQERVVREELGFVREGDVVVEIKR